MTRFHFIEILMILTKYLFDLGVQLTEFSVTVESITLRFYCMKNLKFDTEFPISISTFKFWSLGVANDSMVAE